MEIRVSDLFKYADGRIVPAQHRVNAQDLCSRVNRLLAHAEEDGVNLFASGNTGTLIALPGGGWRWPDHPTGAVNSAHKQGMAVDLHDPQGYLDAWCMQNQWALEELDLYMEHPDATRGQNTPGGWCHLQSRKTSSGRRVFFP